MSNDDQQRDEVTETAGPSTDQHITGREETDRGVVDQPPVSTTPANGSSNKGINTTEANRQ